MKTFLVVPGVFPDQVDAGLYRALVEAYPEGSRTNTHGVTSFSCRLPADDPRAAVIREALAGGIADLSIITLRYEREYTPKDLDDAPLLSPYFSHPVSFRSERSTEGILRIQGKDMKPKAEIAGRWGGTPLIILESLRPEIESVGFIGARLLPIEIVGSGAKALRGKFWELTSTVKLPPMSANVAFFSALTSEEVGSDFATPYILREGRSLEDRLQSPPALRYRADDLAGVPPFDLGLTHETFGLGSPYTVVSQRFRQFCLHRKLPIDWVPIRIDTE